MGEPDSWRGLGKLGQVVVPQVDAGPHLDSAQSLWEVDTRLPGPGVIKQYLGTRGDEVFHSHSDVLEPFQDHRLVGTAARIGSHGGRWFRVSPEGDVVCLEYVGQVGAAK